MFSTLTKRAEVASAQGQMQKALFAQLPERGRSYTVGFQGGKFEVANLHADGSIWCVLDKLTNELTPRFWNAFGLADKLKIYGSNAIVVEINVPLSGISSRVGGAFAVNESGELWLLHRGKVGGGKDGIGKDAFLRHSKLPLVSAVSKDGKAGEFIPVGHIASPTFASDVGRFVRSVAEFKKSVADDAISSLPDPELDLLARKGKKRPAKVLVESYVYVRDPFVVEFVKRRAAGRCELCGCIAPFVDPSGKPFLECHHIQWLAHNGTDCASNACALCPNCHRKMHILHDPADIEILVGKFGTLYSESTPN